jgi:hypothetical protein
MPPEQGGTLFSALMLANVKLGLTYIRDDPRLPAWCIPPIPQQNGVRCTQIEPNSPAVPPLGELCPACAARSMRPARSGTVASEWDRRPVIIKHREVRAEPVVSPVDDRDCGPGACDRTGTFAALRPHGRMCP